MLVSIKYAVTRRLLANESCLLELEVEVDMFSTMVTSIMLVSRREVSSFLVCL